jgi:hypothetical protein
MRDRDSSTAYLATTQLECGRPLIGAGRLSGGVMSVESKRCRNLAASSLRQSRTIRGSSDRQIFRDVAAGYKRLALDEEKLRKEPLRSKERPK